MNFGSSRMMVSLFIAGKCTSRLRRNKQDNIIRQDEMTILEKGVNITSVSDTQCRRK